MTKPRRSPRRGTTGSKPINRRFHRRGFLQALGAGAALVPFIPILPSSAETGEFPRRLVLLFSPNGSLHENWVPQGSETNFTLGPILRPLEPFQDRLIVLDGLQVVRSGPGDGHQMGMGSLWTGNTLLSDNLFTGGNGEGAGWAGGISIDQAIANAIGDQTPYKSLEFGVQCGGNNVWTRMCYAGSNQPIAPEENPAAMFDRLFAGLDVDTTQLERLRVERRSVIDRVQADLAAIQNRVAGEDRVKIESHLDAMREVEKRNEIIASACEAPVQDHDFDYGANDQFPTTSRQMVDQLVMALACDQTRVASLQWSRAVGGQRFTWLGIDRGHHDISHDGNDSSYMVDSITAINTWYAEELAYMLQRMAEIPEGNGTLLDNTIVVWGNELSRGNSHGNHPVPFVIAGGGGSGGALQTGRFLSYDREPHNRLLVSLAQAMGVDIDSFGDNDPSSGGLAGLS